MTRNLYTTGQYTESHFIDPNTGTWYLDSNGDPIYQYMDREGNQITPVGTYTSFAWFIDNEPNTYSWSYCETDEAYYTYSELDSHEKVLD